MDGTRVAFRSIRQVMSLIRKHQLCLNKLTSRISEYSADSDPSRTIEGAGRRRFAAEMVKGLRESGV
jgi:hypothetical protein